MVEAPSQLAVISDILASDLVKEGFNVLMNDRYIVVVSDKFGVATVSGDQDAGSAQKGALEIARQAGLLGISVQVHPFVVSDRVSDASDIYVRPQAIALDIKTALDVRAQTKPVMTLSDANRLVDFLHGKVHRTPSVNNAVIPPMTPEFKRLLLACVEKALGDCKPWVVNVQITADQVIADDFMLAPLLLVAAENWTAPYLAAKRQGGFSFTLQKDADTILGYRVAGLLAASPAIVLICVAAVIRRHCKDDMCVLDPCLLRFADFVDSMGVGKSVLDTEDMDAMLLMSKN